MPIIMKKYTATHRHMLRDLRPASVRFYEGMKTPNTAGMLAFMTAAIFAFGSLLIGGYIDVLALMAGFYFYWFTKLPVILPFKLPKYANSADPHNPPPGKSTGGKSEGILFLGNVNDQDDAEHGMELWLTNNDARTHILYLGTTGSGKTEGLKSMVTNALAWGSGFAYTDGKADTDLWASLYALARRFGRDDDLLILNYMTGNSDDGSLSNTMNPFSNGSSSYLSNMVTNMMPDAGGDNAMWKERAVALMFALMPALTYKRDKHGLLMDVGVVRDYIELQAIIRLSRDTSLPERILHGLQGYLRTLPGYVDAAFDDEGNERPPSPDQPMYDLQVARQQHGYLSMQFTRALQSLADEYGFIFKAQLADIDVLDVVLNRRILVVLIPALEKSGDEAANLGKIVAASLKGMMGATLGNTVEGSWETAIGSKQTRSSSSFMTVFDEVGYYTAQGMAVMAAQARSLGFSLVFASQDLPSMEKRVKSEAKSIVGNCNLKILGRIEDPTETKEFVSRHGGQVYVAETKGLTAPTNTLSSTFMTQPFYDDRSAGLQIRQRVDYDHLRGQREGEAHLIFADWAVKARMFHAVPEKVKALRVHRMLAVPGTIKSLEAREKILAELLTQLKDPAWSAEKASPALAVAPEIMALAHGAALALEKSETIGPLALAAVSAGIGVALTKAASSAKTTVPLAKSAPPRESPLSDKSSQEMRTALPPMTENDQFAIADLEKAPQSIIPQAATPGGVQVHENEVQDLERSPTQGFSTGMGELPNIQVPVTDDEEDEFSLTIPTGMITLVEVMATKLNDGLNHGRRGEKV